ARVRRVGVGTDYKPPATRDAILRGGLENLAWDVDAMPGDVRGFDQNGGCGDCGFGCQLGAKQSTLVTLLEDAHASGARIVVETSAERVVARGGRANGVDAVTRTGKTITVRSQAVIVACGALQTPALLLRSGLAN